MSLPTRAMIMAAGLGTRMAPYTLERPKPLIPLKGKPLIDHVIDRLVQGGVNFIVVNVHYKADQLIAHLEKRRARDKDVEIRISNETDAILDTGGGIAKALPDFGGEPFFTYNSDSVWVEGMGSALARMRARWNPETMDALMLLAPCATAIGYDGRGDFEMDAWGVLKRRAEMNLAPFVWTGLQILHPVSSTPRRRGVSRSIACGTRPSRKGGSSESVSTAYGFMSARRRVSRTPKLSFAISPANLDGPGAAANLHHSVRHPLRTRAQRRGDCAQRFRSPASGGCLGAGADAACGAGAARGLRRCAGRRRAAAAHPRARRYRRRGAAF